MKRLILLLVLLVVPAAVRAQQPGFDHAEMMRRLQDPAAMQRMAREAEAAQKCMKEIDQKKLDALQRRAEAASKEIDALCRADRKKEALERATEMATAMRKDATVKKLRECAKGMSDMMGGLPWTQIPGVEDDDEPTAGDICG